MKKLLILILHLGITCLGGFGCGSDSAAPEQFGTVVIAPEPTSVDVAWQISGPDGFTLTGNGGLTSGERVPGEYTITWGELAGWITPYSQTLSLAAEAQITFTGIYREIPAGFVLIAPGNFQMGAPAAEPGRYDWEGPRHDVDLTRSFLIATTEVNQALWAQVMDTNPSYFSDCDQCPVENVSWRDAVTFCNTISTNEGLTPVYTIGEDDVTWDQAADGYRLPTEAEWEYACRAGSTTGLANGELAEFYCTLDTNLDDLGWYCANSGNTTHATAGKLANAWGLYDMHGNVWEWCWDWRSDYSSDTVSDPIGPPTGAFHAIRGGCWLSRAAFCRSAFRLGEDLKKEADISTGFRIVRNID